MVDVVFYEKPGCINNNKQKKLLIDAGHQVDSRNLLTEQWSREVLLNYFDTLSVKQWFNNSAPDIKSGLIDPDALKRKDALDLMVKNPILIRRPLMRVGNEYQVGFNIELVARWIGLTSTVNEDMERCPQLPGHRCKTTDVNAA